MIHPAVRQMDENSGEILHDFNFTLKVSRGYSFGKQLDFYWV